MKRIGLISDTHGFAHPGVFGFFEKVDEIWHCGDIGTYEMAVQFRAFKPFKAVFGNIDGKDVRSSFPANHRFMCENVDVWMTHIGGYPGNYDRNVKPEIFRDPPRLFLCGHSHILKIIYDKKLDLLHINPGAAGNKGFHKLCTAIRFSIDGDTIKDLEIWQTERSMVLPADGG